MGRIGENQRFSTESGDLNPKFHSTAIRDSFNSKDLDIVDKLIKGEKTTVYVYDQLNNVVKLEYPLDNMITVNSDISAFMAFGGFSDKVAGFITQTDYANVYHGIKESGGEILGSGRAMSAEAWQNIVKKDSELQSKGEAIGAIVTDRMNAIGEYKDDIQNAQIPLLGIRATDPFLVIPGTLLIGFLCGPEAYAGCQNYVESCEAVMDKLNIGLEGLDASEKVHFISVISTRCVSGDASQYTKLGIAAGGISETKVVGDSSPTLQTVEAITEYDDLITQMLHFKTMGCTNVDPAIHWEAKNIEYIQQSEWFEGMVFINCSMPVPCRVLYAASILYPEIITEEYVDGFFQDLVDSHITYLDETQDDGHFSVTDDMTTLITYEDWQKSKA